MEIVLKKGSISEVSCISSLGKTTFDEAFGALFRDRNDVLNYLEATFSITKITASLKKENNHFWIAYADEVPVGYAKFKTHCPVENLSVNNTAQLQKIYIKKDFLSLKIGSRLLSVVLEEAKKEKMKFIWLSVLNSNIPAINFYLKHQFYKKGMMTYTIGKERFEFHTMLRNLDP